MSLQVLTSLWAPFGEAVFEVAAKGKNFNVTQTQLSRVIGEARRVSKSLTAPVRGEKSF